MKKSFPELGLKKSECNETSWVQSVLFWTNFPLGTTNDVLLNRTPQSLTYLKRKSDCVKKPISKDGLEVIWKRLIELQCVILSFNPYGGRMAGIPAEESPFPHRAGNMTPYVSKNPREAFFNYKDLDLGINHNGKDSYSEGKVYGIKYFKGNFKRLVKIKTEVDPFAGGRKADGMGSLSFTISQNQL